MKRFKLKPFVAKVKGVENYALYNLLTGEFYTITPNGDVEELKKALLDAGLIFETAGAVPQGFTADIGGEKNIIQIRELQVRINGRKENNCRDREAGSSPMRFMDPVLLQRLRDQLRFIPVETLRIEARVHEPGKTAYILEEFAFQRAEIFVEEGLNPALSAKYREICDGKNAAFFQLTDGAKELEDLDVDSYRFFFYQHYNPCLGRQAAVDCGGEIKPCLWYKDVLGNIRKDNLKNMIIAGKFDPFWELTKDKIEACKGCEYRYACRDCPLQRDEQTRPYWCYKDSQG